MKNYKITIQYDGTRYEGWQSQNRTDKTIQGKIEAVLGELAGEPIPLIGSGRTDAGVHAKGQVANFHIKEEITGRICKNSESKEIALRDYLNCYLPKDIAIVSVKQVEDRFHSRYHAEKKTYLYRIYTDCVPDVFSWKYVYDYQKPLDAERMRVAAGMLVGTHDFMSFCGNKKMKKPTVRTIYDIRIEETGQEIRIYYTGNGFLQNMVRILTGTLIEIGDGRREPEEISAILEKRDRVAAGYTVPAKGLTLLSVEYQ